MAVAPISTHRASLIGTALPSWEIVVSDRVGLGKRQWLALLIFMLLVIGGLAYALKRGSNASPGEARTATLVVGDQRGGVQSLLQAAGELDDVPYHIEWALFPAAAPLLEALGSGAVDIGGIGGPPFAFAYAGGARIKVVFAYRSITEHGSGASAILVPRASPLKLWADLKGRKIATVRGSAGQDLALQLLEKHGLSARDVNWTYLNNSDAKAALGTGAVDAWSTWGGYVGTALLKDGDRAFADARELPAQAGFDAASDTAIATKRALVEDFVQRLARARKWAIAHRSEQAQVLAKETGIPIDVANFTVTQQQMRPVPIDASVQKEQQAIFERYRRAGLIDAVPNLAGAFDPSFSGFLKP
jgi:sulfonate transport system substrate-binding protein